MKSETFLWLLDNSLQGSTSFYFSEKLWLFVPKKPNLCSVFTCPRANRLNPFQPGPMCIFLSGFPTSKITLNICFPFQARSSQLQDISPKGMAHTLSLLLHLHPAHHEIQLKITCLPHPEGLEISKA